MPLALPRHRMIWGELTSATDSNPQHRKRCVCVPFNINRKATRLSGPTKRRPNLDQKEIKAKLKALEPRFHPWLPQEHRDDITTRWIRFAGRLHAKRIRSDKPVRARPKPNHSTGLKTLLKITRRIPSQSLPQKRVTWTRARCVKEAERLVIVGAPRESYFKKLMTALYE